MKTRSALVQLDMSTQVWSSAGPQAAQLYLKCGTVLLWWNFQSCVLARHWVLISFSQHVICLSVALQVTRTWFASTCCSLEVTEPITCKCSCYQCYTISMDLKMGSSEVTVYFFISLFPNHLQIQCVTNSAITRADDSNLY